MPDTREEKRLLRTSFKKLRGEIPKSEKAILDRTICGTISSLACFRYARTLLLYSPIGSEIDVTPLASLALSKGKRVAYPVCDTESHEMVFRYVNDLSELVSGAYSILEPRDTAPEFQFEKDSLCIVPALSFDKKGYRLGYGKGYYDRFLKRFEGTALGAVYDSLLSEELPRGYLDVSVGIIITERRSIIIGDGK
ncbi:MAG: 5-formyltetrahydrofolate cyclo-ligase [Ruminococcaceae bacterium]|nr:5-formyltetrahydrofolate cyclo-ligase [Oscillospiraceae bacterium]